MSLDLSAAEDAATDEVQKYQGRVPYRHVARAVIAAAAVLIEAAVREQIAAEIEAARDADMSSSAWRAIQNTYTEAARIARGQS